MTATEDDPLGILNKDAGSDDPLGILPKQEVARPALSPLQEDSLRSFWDNTKNISPLKTRDELAPAAMNPELAGVAGGNLEKPTGAAADVLSNPYAAGTLPFTVAGKGVNALFSDIGATLGTAAAGRLDLSGEQGGNLTSFFDDPLAPSPQSKVLASISKSNPITATAGKIAGGIIESAPMLAVMPQGALGKLVAAGFTADMFANAAGASTRLGEEMGKPEKDRDYDKITSALSEIIQGAGFSALGGSHLLGKPLGERIAPKSEAIRELAKQLSQEPSTPLSAVSRGQGKRELGLRLDDGGNVLDRPDLAALADRALQQGPNPVLGEGDISALDRLKQEISNPDVAPVEPTRIVGDRGRQGGESIVEPSLEGIKVKPGFEKTADDLLQERDRTGALQPREQLTPDEIQTVKDIVSEETANGKRFPAAPYLEPRTPRSDAGRSTSERSAIEKGMEQPSGNYLDEPFNATLPEPTTPQKGAEGTTLINPETGRRIVKPTVLSKLQRGRLIKALERGADEQTIRNIMRLKEGDQNAVQERGAAEVPLDVPPGGSKEMGSQVREQTGEETGSLSVADQTKALADRGYGDIKQSKMTPEEKAAAIAEPIPTQEADAANFWDMQDRMKAEKDPAKKMQMYQEFGLKSELIKNRNKKAPGMPPERPTPEQMAASLSEPKTYEINDSIPLKDTAAEVTKFEQEFPGAPKINIAPDFTAMPKTAQDLALSVGSDPRLIEAYVRGGEVWINAGAVTSQAMVRRLALHETGGHWAVDRKLGDGLQRFMEQAHDSWADSETMKSVRERYPDASKVTLGRELVARLAEDPMLAPNLWNRIVAKFRQWMRDAGWVKEVTENDIQALITGAIDGMRKVEKGDATESGMLSIGKKPERGLPENATQTDLISDMTQEGRIALEKVKSTKDEFSGIDVTDLSSADRRNLARLGISMSENRKNRVIATYPSRLRIQDLRNKVSSQSGNLSLKSAKDAANERFPAAGAAGAANPQPGLGNSGVRNPNIPTGTGAPVQRGASLDDIYKIFEPEKKTGPTLKQRGINIIESLRTGLSSKFRPINKLAEDIAKAYGLTKPKDIAGIMEQLKGSQGKGEADVYRFDQDVSKKVAGDEKDFNAYMFLRRSLDRLNQDAADIAKAQAGGNVAQLNRRSVGKYTINELTPKLQALEAKLGPDKLAKFQDAADQYQKHMDEALRLQVESGRMSTEVYQAIKDGNQFYAPFKVMKYIEENTRPEGSGKRIDTVADYTKAMKGIESEDFKLGDMLGAARQGILMSRILADKNVAMRNVAELASHDVNGTFIKKLAPGAEAPNGFEAVNVLENGKRQQYAVRPDVAEAINLYGGTGAGLYVRALSAFSVPFRAGATALNLPFQISNILADVPRQALVSKYGVRSIGDLVHYPLDFIHSLYSSAMGDVFGKKNQLFQDFLDSGVAGSTIQSILTPEALKFQEPTNISKSRRLAKTVLNTIPQIANAVEQTSKILGVKRAMRIEGAQSGRQLAQQIPEAITELRRFSGSPDFGRQGKAIEQAHANLLFMFLNARIQGAIADIGRLGGRDGASQAAQTWLKVGAAVGIPTAYLYYLNQRPGYKEDYDNRPQQEKQNYWLIPKDSYITTEDGEKMRDYYRIPKREISKWFANLTESALNFGQKRDPKAMADFGSSMVQEISPLNVQGNNARERLESAGASLNPLIKAPIELMTGRDLYRHRDIITDDRMKKASPEEQYTPRTAEAFKSLAKAMPDVAPEFLRSPLILENLTKNLTAGLITQFLPRKPIEGRSGLENQPLLQRFQAVPFTDNQKFKDEVSTLERQGADEQLARHRAATKLMDDNKGASLSDILAKTPKDEPLMRHVVDLYIAKQNGITGPEKQLLALPTKQRAAYIANQIKDMTTEKKQQAILDFARKRILTEDVYRQLPNEISK